MAALKLGFEFSPWLNPAAGDHRTFYAKVGAVQGAVKTGPVQTAGTPGHGVQTTERELKGGICGLRLEHPQRNDGGNSITWGLTLRRLAKSVLRLAPKPDTVCGGFAPVIKARSIFVTDRRQQINCGLPNNSQAFETSDH